MPACFTPHWITQTMALIFIGIGFGTIMGAGLYFLILRPALIERKESEKDEDA